MSASATIMLTGFISNEPEEIPGKDMLKFKIPVSYGKDGNARTDWYSVFLSHSNPSYKLAPYLRKGSCVVVIGDLSPSIWYEGEHKQPFMNLSVFAGIIKFGAGAKDSASSKKKSDYGSRQSSGTSNNGTGQTAQEIFNAALQGKTEGTQGTNEQRKSNIVTNPQNDLPF